MKVAYLTNAHRDSGVGLRAEQIKQVLLAQGVGVQEYYLEGNTGRLTCNGELLVSRPPWPGILRTKTIGWIRLGRALVGRLTPESADLVHATNQTLSFIAPRQPLVVTVHDIIEWVEPQSWLGGMSARYLYRGITHADQVIAVSQYTATTLQERLAVPADKITVIPNGVEESFRELSPDTRQVATARWRERLSLQATDTVVLYVGSDHPRKNVVGAVRAFAEAAKQVPGLVFVKVGAAGIASGRKELTSVMTELGVENQVRILDTVTKSELVELYNLADVLLYPSFFEGFGLPPLQAMACGTPVVTSNVTSLPEVVGEAAIMVDPQDTLAIAQAVVRVVTESAVAAELREKGLIRAQEFSWEKAGEQVRKVYERVLRNS